MLEQVGRYKIKGQLGRGAMGVVYLADDPLLNRQAAIKAVDLSGGASDQAEFLQSRLLRDARAAAGLSHPNIVGVFDVVEEGNAAYLVMEYIPGETLAAILNRTAIPDPAFTLRVLREMAAALDYTHAHGIIHRDIKPANVMIDGSQTAKIMDFGIARIADSRTNTPTGMVMGTIEYMSPEQVKGEAVDGRSDQFALGAVAFRMLTGTTVFGQHSLATLAYKIVNEPAPMVRTHNAGLPADVDTVVSRAMSKSPADRFANCSSFVNALSAALTSPDRTEPTSSVAIPTPVAVPSSPAPAPGSTGSGSGKKAVIAGLVVVAGLIAAWFRPWEKREAPPPPDPVAQTAVATPTAAPPVTPEPTPSKPTTPEPISVSGIAPHPAAKHPATPTPTPTPGDDDSSSIEKPPVEPIPPEVPKPAVDAHQRGVNLAAANRLDDAIAAFSQAISLHPNWPASYFDRGGVYQKKGDFASAIRDYTQFIQMQPQAPNAHVNRGACYVRIGDDNHALLDFNDAIRLKPDAAVALFGRANILMRRHDYRGAIKDLDLSIRIAPGGVAAYNTRGNAKRNLGDEAGAQADYQKARELKGK